MNSVLGLRAERDDDRAFLELDSAALVAPGQAAVFYSGDEVTGGGIVVPGASGREATRTE